MDEKGDSNPFGKSPLECVVMKTLGKLLNIGTWNVRTLYQPGKLDNLIQELNHMKIDIVGISETRWTDTGKIVKDDYTMIYSGGEDQKNGVGIILRNEVAKSMIEYWPIPDRVVMVKLQAKPFNINIIQVYAPTQDYDDETTEEFYEQIQSAVSYTKSSDIICIMGDLNAKVGNVTDLNIIANYGLGKQNERGQRLIEFCNENNMVIMNTWFQQPLCRLYTWKSPGDISRNQIDYIMINQRFRNCVKQARTYPGADINSDHNPVTIKFKVKLKKIKRNQAHSQIDYNLLKDDTYKRRYNILVKNYYDVLGSEKVEQDHESEEEHVEKEWSKVKLSLQNAAKELLPKKVKKRKEGG